jgi:hypothetical protein
LLLTAAPFFPQEPFLLVAFGQNPIKLMSHAAVPANVGWYYCILVITVLTKAITCNATIIFRLVTFVLCVG